MNKKISFLILSLLMITTISYSNKEIIEASIGELPDTKYSCELSSTYYDSAKGLTGDALLEELATITLDNHKYYNTYGETRGGNAYSDRDPNDSTKLIDFYTGWSIAKDWDGGTTWNREHVWCQSHSGGLFGESGAGADIHHIRPEISSINSSRGNKLFTDQEHISETLSKHYYNNQLTGCYEGSNYWEPRDEVKGDVARILMYLYMHYSTEVSANSNHTKAGKLQITNIAYTKDGTDDAAWDMLVAWSDLDPVDEFESNRNNYCASVTGTRNPFIDNSSYANAIWTDGEVIEPLEPETPVVPEEPETPITPNEVTVVTFDSTSQGYINAEEITNVVVDNNVTLTFDKGTNSNAPKYYESGTAIRTYGGNTITISSSCVITKVEITFGSSDGSNTITSDVGVFNTNIWNGESNSIKLTISGTSGNRRIKSITITYGIEEVNYYNNVNKILNDYYDEGIYTRETKINLTEQASLELVQYFHANVTILERTTYFNTEALWMSRDDDKYSYYGTLNGNMTNASVNNVGDTSSNICVSNTTMEDYYTTLFDIKNFVGSKWSKSNNIYSSTNEDVITQFLDFTAPCFLGLDDTMSHYFSLSHVEVEDKETHLELRLVAKNVDSSKFIENSNNVLSVAKITKGWPSFEEPEIPVDPEEPVEPTTKEVVFEFGDNGSASHSDGSALELKDASYTSDNYSLTFSSVSGVYKNARDALGNSCLKLGTSNVVGSFIFVVPNDVDSIVIYVAQYKTNASAVIINDVTYTITTPSNSGEYTAIEIDTSINKTISLTTTSSCKRAMINTIKYIINE